MHELSIAHSIFNIVLKEKKSKNLPEIKIIGLNIGALSGILPDALEFGFDAIKKDTQLGDTRLEINRIPVKAVCGECHRRFEINNYNFNCTYCNSSSVKVEMGQEIDIAFLEVEDELEPIHE